MAGEEDAARAAVEELFDTCDRNNDGALDFAEVAALFKQLSPEQSAESACNAAVEALLLVDADVDRHLSREEFAALLFKVSQLSGVPLRAAAERLLAGRRRGAAAAGGSAAVAAEVAAAGPPCDLQRPAAAVGPPGEDKRLRELFDLWDASSSGSIDLAELCQGLAKLRQPISSKQDVTSTISDAAAVLAAHDADGDRVLSFAEFSEFMGAFMGKAGFGRLEDVLDQLLALAATKRDSKRLQRALDGAQPQIERLLSRDAVP